MKTVIRKGDWWQESRRARGHCPLKAFVWSMVGDTVELRSYTGDDLKESGPRIYKMPVNELLGNWRLVGANVMGQVLHELPTPHTPHPTPWRAMMAWIPWIALTLLCLLGMYFAYLAFDVTFNPEPAREPPPNESPGD